MHKFGVFAALTLSWITASCAERMMHPAVIPQSTLPKAASKLRPANVEPRRQAEKIAEDTRNLSAMPPRQVSPSANARPVPSPEPQAQLPQVSQQPKETPTSQVVALPPPPEPAEPNFPFAALMPPPPEPAEPSLPSQEEVIIEGSIPIPFPDLASNLSLRPQFDWVDTVGSIEVPHSPLPDAREASPEERIPSLIRNPWPLSMDGS
jgi:hypothetical protein